MNFRLNSQCCCTHALLGFVLLGISVTAVAQTDEIQVYDAEIADQGVFNLMIHTNYTPIGRKTADFPGGIIPNHSVNGTAEWAYTASIAGSSRDFIYRYGLHTHRSAAGRLTASSCGNCSSGRMRNTTGSSTV